MKAKSRDMRPWLVKDPHWIRGYDPALEQEQAAPVTERAFERLLDSAAVSGDSAFIGVCFDIANKPK